MFSRTLRCSFCRRDSSQVAKLVAGPRVYICDRCAYEAVRIMEAAAPPCDPSTAAPPGLITRAVRRIRSTIHRGLRISVPYEPFVDLATPLRRSSSSAASPDGANTTSTTPGAVVIARWSLVVGR